MVAVIKCHSHKLANFNTIKVNLVISQGQKSFFPYYDNKNKIQPLHPSEDK